jgi:hypothetical protein
MIAADMHQQQLINPINPRMSENLHRTSFLVYGLYKYGQHNQHPNTTSPVTDEKEVI